MKRAERSIVGTTMFGHALVHTCALSIPVLIPEWIAEFGLAPSTIGLSVGVGYALFGFGSVPAGIASDVYGAGPLVGICFAGVSLGFLGIALSPGVATLTLALAVWGIAASIYHPVGLSLISRGTSRSGRALGYHGMAGNVGVAVGPLATALLVSAFDWRVAAVALAVPGLLAAPLAFRLGPGGSPVDGESRATGSGSTAVAADGRVSVPSVVSLTRRTFGGVFVLLFVIVAFEGLYYRGVLTFLPDVLAGFTPVDAVDLFGRTIDPSRSLYVGLLAVGVVGQYAGGRLSDRIDPTLGATCAFFGLAVIALLFVPAATAGTVPLILVSALLGVVLFAEQPLFQATVARHSSPDTRGASYGFVYAGVFGVGAAGATATGYLLTYASTDAVFVFLAFVAGMATVTGLYLYRVT